MTKICYVEECGKKEFARKMCAMHYKRFQKYGDVTTVRKSAGTLGKGNGWQHPSGYRLVSINAKVRFEHRVIMEKVLGRSLLPHENVHHINGVRSDNRVENLELWSKSQPAGQRVEDKTAWAIEWLRTYRPDALDSSVREI